LQLLPSPPPAQVPSSPAGCCFPRPLRAWRAALLPAARAWAARSMLHAPAPPPDPTCSTPGPGPHPAHRATRHRSHPAHGRHGRSTHPALLSPILATLHAPPVPALHAPQQTPPRPSPGRGRCRHACPCLPRSPRSSATPPLLALGPLPAELRWRALPPPPPPPHAPPPHPEHPDACVSSSKLCGALLPSLLA
jgi:hypothetical protein